MATSSAPAQPGILEREPPRSGAALGRYLWRATRRSLLLFVGAALVALMAGAVAFAVTDAGRLPVVIPLLSAVVAALVAPSMINLLLARARRREIVRDGLAVPVQVEAAGERRRGEGRVCFTQFFFDHPQHGRCAGELLTPEPLGLSTGARLPGVISESSRRRLIVLQVTGDALHEARWRRRRQ